MARRGELRHRFGEARWIPSPMVRRPVSSFLAGQGRELAGNRTSTDQRSRRGSRPNRRRTGRRTRRYARRSQAAARATSEPYKRPVEQAAACVERGGRIGGSPAGRAHFEMAHAGGVFAGQPFTLLIGRRPVLHQLQPMAQADLAQAYLVGGMAAVARHADFLAAPCAFPIASASRPSEPRTALVSCPSAGTLPPPVSMTPSTSKGSEGTRKL